MAGDFTLREYADMHLVLGECGGNASAAVRRYRQLYPRRRRQPDRRTIEAVERRLRETGSVATTRGSGGGRPHTITPALEQSIVDAVYDDPTTSVRRLARQFGLSSSDEVNVNPLFKSDRKGG